MKFRTKIIAIYAVLLFSVACIIGISYYKLNAAQHRDTEYRSTETTAEQFVQNMDNMFESMEFVFGYILTDSEIVEALVTLAGNRSAEYQEVYFSEPARLIRNKLTTDFILNNYYRVVVFNDFGAVVAEGNTDAPAVNVQTDVAELSWYEKLQDTRGTPVIIGMREDDWGKKSSAQIVSLAKELQGMSMGYMEVQQEADRISELFQFPGEEGEVLVVTEEGELLYSSMAGEDQEFYMAYMENAEEGVHELDDRGEILVRKNSPDWGFSLCVIRNTASIYDNLLYIVPTTFAITVSFFLASVICVILIAFYLTNPLHKLIAVMEQTEIENLQDEIPLEETGNDEIMRLNTSYQNMLKRLDLSIQKEKQMSYLQLQAQFDLLQTQVNPHFLYNILNVISNRGLINDDEDICNICDSLAKILRYATNTKERYASIRAEAAYLEQYFYLLKSRYRHRLVYHIDVEESIENQIIPKITIQQIVENSIAHGYENTPGTKEIWVSGWEQEGYWYLKVRDNGEGFASGKISQLEEQIQTVRDRLLKDRDSMEMQIGGMGLINTYARLLLLYGDDLVFRLANTKLGAEIVIGARMEREETDVQSDSSR